MPKVLTLNAADDDRDLTAASRNWTHSELVPSVLGIIKDLLYFDRRQSVLLRRRLQLVLQKITTDK